MSKGTKSIAFYLMMILIFGSLMYFIAKEGESQQLENSIASIQNAPSNLEEGFTIFTQLLVHNIESSIGILLLQIITILLTCRLFGWLFQKIGQPTVIGEIVAGIVLGPSVLGNLFPEASAFLFPVESLVNINMLSQFGLILFMFAIGMELNISEVSPFSWIIRANTGKAVILMAIPINKAKERKGVLLSAYLSYTK